MRLRSAVLRHIRQHRNLQLNFDPHLTLIGGRNEAGKSTVVEALHKGLFLKASATGRGVEELRSRLHAGLPEVEICFEAGGRSWQLSKRFSGASGTCLLSDDRGLALRGAAAEEELARLLGIERLVEGRQIGQLAERWAHLWVRQGDAADNLLGGPGSRYDIDRLVDQLQRRRSGSALESPLDRQVADQLQQQLDQIFTATGKVKAGSPLARARALEEQSLRRLEESRARWGELEQAMERLRAIGERLDQIESQERPALQRLGKLEEERTLRQAELRQVEQQVESLRQATKQILTLDQLLEQQGKERGGRQERLELGAGELARLDTQLEKTAREAQELEQHRRQLVNQRELAQLLLDLDQLRQENQRLQEHRDRFQELERQAGAIKDQLRDIPEIGLQQVASLRQAEQRLLQADTRCQAMATGVELLEADRTVWLNGEEWPAGQPQRLIQAAELRVGDGVRLRISPGGGEVLTDAQGERDRCRVALENLLRTMKLSSSEEAERIASGRQALTSELTHLRQAAKAIPSWSLLGEQLAGLASRRQRLQAGLERHGPLRLELEKEGLLPPTQDRAALEAWLDDRRHDARGIDRRIAEASVSLEVHGRQRRNQAIALEADRTRIEQLTGSIGTLVERRGQMLSEHGDPEALQRDLHQAEQVLAVKRASLTDLDQQLHAGPGELPLERRQRSLEEEKDQLLTERGQKEERCLNLGSADPVAELEHSQAAWERAVSERSGIEQQAEALRMLTSLFHEARSDLSRRYSEPLRDAISSYLAEVTIHAPDLGFDPQRGFGDLRLRQHDQTYKFEQLSGGMREQLSAALRLGMAEVLKPAFDEILPLVFDDAFTAADPSRLEGVQRMLRRGVDQGIQIILLSCTPEDYGSLMVAGGSIIELDSFDTPAQSPA